MPKRKISKRRAQKPVFSKRPTGGAGRKGNTLPSSPGVGVGSGESRPTFQVVFRKLLVNNAKVKGEGLVRVLRKKGYIKFDNDGKIIAGANLKKKLKSYNKKKGIIYVAKVKVEYRDKKGKRKKPVELMPGEQIIHRSKGQSFSDFLSNRMAFGLFDIAKTTLREKSLDWSVSGARIFLEKNKHRKAKNLAKEVNVTIEIEGHKSTIKREPVKRKKKRSKRQKQNMGGFKMYEVITTDYQGKTRKRRYFKTRIEANNFASTKIPSKFSSIYGTEKRQGKFLVRKRKK